jgi:hypothetical protein
MNHLWKVLSYHKNSQQFSSSYTLMIESGLRGDYEKNNTKLSHSRANADLICMALLYITQ